MITSTNLDIKYAACLHTVHISQHPSSCPNNKVSTNYNGKCSEKNFLHLQAGTYGISPKRSTWRCHPTNEGKSSFDAGRVRALGALRSSRCRRKLAVDKRQETHFLNNKKKEKWLEEYVERETAGARKLVEDTEGAIRQEQEDMGIAVNAGLTTNELEKKCHGMMVTISDSLSDLASSDDVEAGQDEDDEETAQGKLSEDDKPSWVMGTIYKMVQQRKERFQQKQIKLNQLTEPGWGDTADYFRERDNKYSTSVLTIPAVVKL